MAQKNGSLSDEQRAVCKVYFYLYQSNSYSSILLRRARHHQIVFK